jgi:hypothetical protein
MQTPVVRNAPTVVAAGLSIFPNALHYPCKLRPSATILV